MDPTFGVQLFAGDPAIDAHRLAAMAARHDVRAIHVEWASLRERLLAERADVSELTDNFRVAELTRIGGLDATPLTAESDDEFERQTDDVYMQLHIARRIGLDSVSLRGGPRDAVAFDFLLAGLTKLTLLAERSEMYISLRNGLNTTLEQVDDLHCVFSQLPTETLTLDVDVVALHQACVNPCEVVWGFPRRIARIRLADIRAGRRVPLRQGEINADAVIEALKGIAYDGPILLRVDGDQDAPDRLEADLRFVRDRL